MSEESPEDQERRIAGNNHEWAMNQAMTQFMTQDHADVQMGDYMVHLCFQDPCTHDIKDDI